MSDLHSNDKCFRIPDSQSTLRVLLQLPVLHARYSAWKLARFAFESLGLLITLTNVEHADSDQQTFGFRCGDSSHRRLDLLLAQVCET
jgi:hypothetical protein